MAAYKHLSVYHSYFSLGADAYREKVRFVEEKHGELDILPLDERLEIEIDYLLCVFELGRYERYLQKADNLIEAVIRENIYTVQGMPIYEELLFRKAACLYQLQRIDECREILEALIRMSAGNNLYLGLYLLLHRHAAGEVRQTMKAFAMACLLLVVSITLIQILLVEPLLESYLQLFLTIRTILFVTGIGILSMLELSIHWQIYRQTGFFTHRLLNKIFNT